MKNDNNGLLKTIVFIVIFLILLSFFNKKNEHSNNSYYNENVLRILSSKENEVLNKDLLDIADELNIDIDIDYEDTLDMMDILNYGEKYDAVWSSNSIWLYQLDKNVVNVKNSKSLSINPIIFGIKKSKAEELGFINKEIHTEDIVSAIKSGKLKFSMSNPVSTNSGASAYLGILQTLAGNPEVLTSKELNNKELKEELKTFFSGVERTSGSEDFLEELFLNGDYDAVVTYESSIINMNKKLSRQKKETLYAIYPVDGVSISDSVLAFIDNKNENKEEKFLKFQEYLLSEKGQKILESYGRRTWFGGVNDKAPKDIFNKEWGIDTTKYITPIKYPSTTVINEALALYQNALRKPVHVVFCLDYSGSMSGEGIEELRKAMQYVLTYEEASKKLIQFTENDIVDILAFSDNVKTLGNAKDTNNFDDLISKINERVPSGVTALYPASIKALEILANEDQKKYNTSVILMTDGEGNVGSYRDLESEYKSINKDIPIYSIMFGSANKYQLDEIARLTNGKVFDGKYDLVAAFKNVRGYN